MNHRLPSGSPPFLLSTFPSAPPRELRPPSLFDFHLFRPSPTEKNEGPPYPPLPFSITDKSFTPFINEKRSLVQRTSARNFVGKAIFLSISTFGLSARSWEKWDTPPPPAPLPQKAARLPRLEDITLCPYDCYATRH